MIRAAAILLALLATVLPATAVQVVTALSRLEVAITSSFAGETVTLFGNIEPEPGAAALQGPFHIVVAITGPRQDWVARRKTNNFGIWINTEQVQFRSFPSFYHVLADTRLENITDAVTLAELGIPLAGQARFAADAGWGESITFGAELVRLMESEGLFGFDPQGVTFRSDTFYSGQVTLPSDVPPGRYLAHTYLFKDGALLAERTEDFIVRKIGFERFLGLAAIQQPLLYGLVCVVLAVFTGWLGGVVFRR